MKPEQFRKRFFEGVPRYRWHDTLGRGATGVVYKALDLELDEVVAIKVLSPDLEQDEDALLARFKREINLNRKIKHPNVARMFDFGISGDYPYITMEYVKGKDLWTLIGDRNRLAPAEAISILRQIARGCEAVHRLGIVHRDLKSSNVIVDDDGAVAILDFGLARGKMNPNVTQTSVLLGTPHYMSPEQALGQEVDARSDVYSIGVIAFECLTGELPFTGNAPVTVAMKQVNEPVPPTLSMIPEVFPELRDLVLRALSKDPDDRYATAGELETALGMLQPAAGLGEDEAPAGFMRRWAESDTISEEVETALNSIVLPIRHVAPPPPEDSPGPRLPLVLVVNDNVPELLRWATAVCSADCETYEVRSGPEALEAFLKRPADLVLMDVDLPGLDGFDTTRIIRAQPGGASVPILLVSAPRDRSQLAFGMQSGATDLIARPVTAPALAGRVWQLLESRGFERAPEDGRKTPKEMPLRVKKRK